MVSVTCPAGSTATSALYAEVVSGSLTSVRADRVDMNGPAGSSGTPAQLWLTAEGKTLTPSALVSAGTPRGETTASVRINVVMP